VSSSPPSSLHLILSKKTLSKTSVSKKIQKRHFRKLQCSFQVYGVLKCRILQCSFQVYGVLKCRIFEMYICAGKKNEHLAKLSTMSTARFIVSLDDYPAIKRLSQRLDALATDLDRTEARNLIDSDDVFVPMTLQYINEIRQLVMIIKSEMNNIMIRHAMRTRMTGIGPESEGLLQTEDA
jgi:hypothetical protein